MLFIKKSFPVLKNSGFTLTELLVAVLIIGVLAAAAVSQYTKAVEKTRMTEAITAVESIAKANRLYYMANGTYTRDINELDVSYGGAEGRYGNLPDRIGKDFVFTASAHGVSGYIAMASRRVNAADTRGEQVYSLFIMADGSRKCALYSRSSDLQRRLCSEWADNNVTVWY